MFAGQAGITSEVMGHEEEIRMDPPPTLDNAAY
jgi:hypothetical protein